MEKIAEKSCIGFVDVLGSKAPVPGGGGGAPYGRTAYRGSF